MACSSFIRSEPSLTTMVATTAVLEGLVAFAGLIVVLTDHTGSARSARLAGPSALGWVVFGATVLVMLTVGITAHRAVAVRVMSLLQGEPTAIYRSWFTALELLPKSVIDAIRRFKVGLLTTPLRGDRSAGGIARLLLGGRRVRHLRQRVALLTVLRVAEDLGGRRARERSAMLIEGFTDGVGIYDPPMAEISLGIFLVAVVVVGLGALLAPFLGMVLAIVALLALVVVGVAGAGPHECSLYVYLTESAATLGFLADDLRSVVVPVSSSPRPSR